MLENHAHTMASEFNQLPLIHGHDLVPIDFYRALGRFDQARNAPHQGGLTASREPHDYKRLSLLNLEGDVFNCDHMACALLHFGSG